LKGGDAGKPGEQLFDLASEGGEEGGLGGLQEGEAGDPGEDLVSHMQMLDLRVRTRKGSGESHANVRTESENQERIW
jgi:hypothetical protein